MANYICQPLTPKVSSRFISKVTVPEGGLTAGSVVLANALDNTISGNIEVYTAQTPSTLTLGSNFFALVLNDGFETLEDGRRPAGQPNYYSYSYNVGETAPIMFLENHLKFNIGFDVINPSTLNLAVVGNYLVPVNGSTQLNAVSSIPSGTGAALKILSNYNTPTGGNYGGGMSASLVCVALNFGDIDTGAYITSFSVPNQVGSSVINHAAGTITLNVAGARNNLTATFILSPDASAKVGAVAQVSGVTTNDFTSPVTYVVTSETGETKSYVVTVSLATFALDVTENEYIEVDVIRNGESVAVGPNAVTYGDVLTINTTLTTGYTIGDLTVNGVEIATGGTHTVVGDVDVVGIGVPVESELTITQTNATVTVVRDGVELESGDPIYYGEDLVITATPAEGYSGVTLTVNGDAFESGTTFVVLDEDVSVVATGTV